MMKPIFLVLLNIAIISCGDNASNKSDSAEPSTTDTPVATNPGVSVDSDTSGKLKVDTSTTGNTTPVGATDGSNNTGAVGGSIDSKNSGDTKSISGSGKGSETNDKKRK
ncbi:MAG: hypothetical protein ABIQ00_16740 [Chitinophagaceae bacterium]